MLRIVALALIFFGMSVYGKAVYAGPDQEQPALTIEQLLRDGEVLIKQQKQQQKQRQEQLEWAKNILESLDKRTGRVELSDGLAELQVPDSFYYLGAEDTQKILVEVWGNPPGSRPVGMLLPSGKTPFSTESWGVLIEYSEEGYVSDEDAEQINYDDLLAEMQEDTRKASQQRVKAGYPEIELMGWAQRPYYDNVAKKLHWAKEIRFAGAEENTLNYNIRVLGRKGVLSMNFVAGMDQLDEIANELDLVLGMVEFSEGQRYQDFDPELDKIAAYGIGALVAGKVLAKAGILVTLLLVFKKFWFLLLIAVPGVLRKLFSRYRSQNRSRNKKPPVD